MFRTIKKIWWKVLKKRTVMTVDEEKALRVVRDLLANSCIVHQEDFRLDGTYTSENVLRSDALSETISSGMAKFNMKTASMTSHSCGTVACIGGWMAHVMQENPNEYVYSYGHKSGMQDLFYPNVIEDWNNLGNEEAVKAIDNFLETGDPMWSRVARETS